MFEDGNILLRGTVPHLTKGYFTRVSRLYFPFLSGDTAYRNLKEQSNFGLPPSAILYVKKVNSKGQCVLVCSLCDDPIAGKEVICGALHILGTWKSVRKSSE